MARGRRSTKNNIQSQSQTTNISTSQHNKLCECCGTPNNLQHCTTCNLVFHSSCYPSSTSSASNNNNNTELFNNDWSCAYCIIDGNGIDFSSSSKLSVKEQQIEARKVVSKIEGMKNNAQQLKVNTATSNNDTNNNNTGNNNMEVDKEEENSWICHKCNNNNPSSRSRCVNCLGWKKKKKVGINDDNNNSNTNMRGDNNNSSTRGGVRNSITGGANNKKMVRNIAQPKSYKEPSTSCKLRSGDVNFPKEQQQQQQRTRENDDGVQSSTDGEKTEVGEEIEQQKKKRVGRPSNNTKKKQQSPQNDMGTSGAASNAEGAAIDKSTERQCKDNGKNEEVVKKVVNASAEESGDNKKAIESTSDEQNTASSTTPKTTVQSSDSSSKNSSTKPLPQQQQSNNEIMQPLLSSNFNTALKSALNSYHNSTTLVRSENNPQSPPVPPPFLSHVEECTLKTALAFVLAKANKKKGCSGEFRKESGCSCNSLMAVNDMKQNGGGRGVGSSTSNSSLIRGSMGKVSGSRMESIINPSSLDNNNTPQRTSGVTSLLGGLLPLPSSSSRRITPLPGVDINPERKLQHVRDVLKLAVSAVLPLYRGALEVKEESSSASAQYKDEEDDDDATTLEQSEPQGTTTKKNESASRKPCAVYDYEAAVETVSSFPSQSNSNAESTRQLDGLCDHAITRLSALIRQEETLKSKGNISRVGRSSSNNATKTNENDDNESTANGSPTVVTNKSGEARSISTLNLHSKQQDDSNNIRDAIMKLIYNDLIGDAYHHGSSHMSKHSHRLSTTDIERECAERRIEKIMAVCHVLHRMLFLDKTSSLGTECVVVICSILSELYSNQYHGRTFLDDGGVLDEDGDSKSNGSSSNSEKQRRLTSNKNHGNKEKYQVVSSRWGGSSTSSATSYTNDRHERRLQSVNILSQRRYSGAKRSSQIIPESKEGEEKRTQLPLPRIGDVLAVNLLRLLEGAAAIRLHHRQQCHVSSSSPPLSSSRYHHRTSSRKDDEYMLEKIASMAATEVLTEIRSNMEHDLLTPFLVEDSATFFVSEKVRSAGKSSLLLPGGKIMMRLHVFSLLQKLSLYEQV